MEKPDATTSGLLLPPDPRLSNIGLMAILDSHKQKINKRAFARFQYQQRTNEIKTAIDERLRLDERYKFEDVKFYQDHVFVSKGVRLDPKFVPGGYSTYLRKQRERSARDDVGRASEALAAHLVIPAKSQSQIVEAIDHETGEIQRFARNKASLNYEEIKDKSALRQERFRLQKVSRSILKSETRQNSDGFEAPIFRVCDCHRNIVSNAAGVSVVKGKNGAKFSGVQQCGSVWTCPVCSAKISEHRRSTIREMADVWQKSGKGLIFITNTIRHGRNDDLRLLLNALSGDIFNRYINHRTYKTARKELGYIGRVRALEVTHGQANGWHPHVHEIWFIDRPLSDKELKELQSQLFKAWNKTLINAGFPAVTEKRGLTVQNASCAADYLTKFGHDPKWDIGHEMTKNHSKKSDGGKGSNPFDLLRLAGTGDTHAAALFKEYAYAFFGKRQLFFSQGLKDFFQVKFLTDDEILALRDVDEKPIYHINKDDWRLIVRSGSVTTILDLAESVDSFEGIKNYISWLQERFAKSDFVTQKYIFQNT